MTNSTGLFGKGFMENATVGLRKRYSWLLINKLPPKLVVSQGHLISGGFADICGELGEGLETVGLE